MDNDDFKDDTLTGANTSHRTNVMFVQPANLEMPNDSRNKLDLIKPKDIKLLVDKQKQITPYKTMVKGVPPIRTEINVVESTTDIIRTEEIIHTLVRMDKRYENVEPINQKIGSFAGFQSLIQPAVVKSKPYYFLTLPKPPHKSVIHEVMTRMVSVIEEKNMPFVQLIGDQPVYTLIVQIKNEHAARFKNIIPVLGPFHTQCSFITAINKRFSGSGISDLIVSADIIAEKSIDQAFRAKHFRRIVRALQLVYESLQRGIIQLGIKEGLIIPERVQVLLENIRSPSTFSKEQLQDFVQTIKESEEFTTFMCDSYKIIENYNSEMANYWLSFMNMVEVLIMNIHSLKVKDGRCLRHPYE